MSTTAEAFKLDPPQVSGPLAVFPVLGPEPTLFYRSFADARGLGAFIKELDAGASVESLLLDNPTDRPLLVYEGEEVLGAQQNRSFDASVLVDARSRGELPVTCVEAGRWDGSRSDEHFEPAPQAVDPSLREVKRARANLRAAALSPAKADQGEVWREIEDRVRTHAVSSDTSALSDVYDSNRGRLDEMLKGVRHLDGQVGAVASIDGRPVALDLVGRPDVFASLLPRLTQGYALDALASERSARRRRPPHPPDEIAAGLFLHRALDATRDPLPTSGLGTAFGISTEELTGSRLEHEDELVQLSAFPAGGGGATGESGARGRIARPSRRRGQ